MALQQPRMTPKIQDSADVSTPVRCSIYTFITPRDLQHLIARLETALPYSIPLLRRLQFPYKNPGYTVLATFPPRHTTETQSVSRCETDPPAVDLPQCFAVGFFDPLNAPSMQAWIFSSLELISSSNSTNSTTLGLMERTSTAQLLDMFAYHRDTRPESACNVLPGPVLASSIAISVPDHPEFGDSGILFIGTIHERVAHALRIAGVVRDDISGPGGPYSKYIISAVTSRNDDSPQLPESMFLDTIREDYALVLKTNTLVRSISTIEHLPNVAVRLRKTGDALAWGFLGADGSIRTLHCMPEYRRQGLAKTVVLKLLEERLSQFGNDGLAHVDIDGHNAASIRLFNTMGARFGWEAYWIRIDLGQC